VPRATSHAHVMIHILYAESYEGRHSAQRQAHATQALDIATGSRHTETTVMTVGPAVKCAESSSCRLSAKSRLTHIPYSSCPVKDEWLASGVPLLNKFFSIYFDPILKIHCAGGCLCRPPALWFRGGGRAPANKDSHLCWHKTAGGCCARQHKCENNSSKDWKLFKVTKNTPKITKIPKNS
jgi:hypothetical protein